ncbi:uncharacterized protein [Rutidosis leptorrhynchoides]|uniref:uncharacterized protein n=1 Tax=Rutidosis leptorrhynchoides TaxID=125765 RepID=UPI003A998A34
MGEASYILNPPTRELYQDDEVIDTLSLSDLQIYENNGDPQGFYQFDDQNLNLDDDDHFEFSSELLNTSMSNSVVFCGKIIPYKEPNVSQNVHKLESKKQNRQRWKFVKFFKNLSRDKSNIDSKDLDLKYEVPIRRVSILASVTKPRWYLLMFGYGSNGISTQMHIRDLKKRQTSIRFKDGSENKSSEGIVSWRLVRFLGCGGGGGGGNCRPNAIMKIE